MNFFWILSILLLIIILGLVIATIVLVASKKDQKEKFLQQPLSVLSKTQLKDFLRKAPKTDLHFHIESGTNPQLAFRIAKRNGIPLGTKTWPWKTPEELEKALQFKDLESFLLIYYAVSAALKQPIDFEEQAKFVSSRLKSMNVRHAEIFFDPQTFTTRGVSFQTVADNFNKGLDDARKQGISVRLIVSILRDSPVGTPFDQAVVDQVFLKETDATGWASIKQAVQYNQKTQNPDWKIIGIGLDSNEKPYPPDLFKDIYAYAKQHGLLRTAHAGEEGPANYVWQAIRHLDCQRIDHGVHSADDANLCAYLATPHDTPSMIEAYHQPHRIPITCCPKSNYRLKVFPDPRDINLGILLGLGIQATVNSDDPMYTGWVNDSWDLIIDNCMDNSNNIPLTFADLHTLIINGFEASWLPLHKKSQLIQEANNYFISHGGLLYHFLIQSHPHYAARTLSSFPRLPRLSK